MMTAEQAREITANKKDSEEELKKHTKKVLSYVAISAKLGRYHTFINYDCPREVATRVVEQLESLGYKAFLCRDFTMEISWREE